MEMRNHGSDFHVVQQSRRDKLRNNQNSSTSSQHLGYYRANLDHLSSLHQGLNVDLVQLPGWRYGNISCDSSSVLSSEMLNNFASNSHSNKLVQTGDGFAQPVKVSSSEPQNCCTWKSVESQKIGSVWSGIDGNMNPLFVGGETTLCGSLRLNNDVVPVSGIDVKTSDFGYQEKLCGDMQVRSSSHYQNTLQEVVTSASIGTRELEMTSMALQNTRETERNLWLSGEDETRLLPSYVDQSSQLFVNHNNASNLVNTNTQALSLSLSSVSPPKSYSDQIGERINNMPDLKPLKALGNADMVGNLTFTHRDLVPLGPFTGYATILKSSGFLKPAQQLLDEFCNFTAEKSLNLSEVSGNNIMDEVRISGEAVNATPCMAVDSGASSSTFYNSNEKSHEFRGASCSNQSYPRPEYLQNKVKLLYMQDEVCRRYRQYHQQMQMVVSSFESVAGLSAATPYISLALKAVARQFRGFKNAISDQLRNVRKALGEDTGASSKRDASLKITDQNLQNQNGSGERLQYLEAQQTHVWRPQRGLPERAVAVLRAWLFDHFLHPYPTDTDKHMLASQTGLTRNQVSNWFINARVRVWKPMVEEIHMLETKEMVEKGGGSNVGKADGELIGTQPNERLNENQFLNVPNVMAAEECPPIMMREKSYHQADMWNQDKRSRIECGHQLPVGFMPYQRNSLEIHGGLGAVSLTLGLRQSIEGPQHQQQHETQLRQQFGGHIIRDFAG